MNNQATNQKRSRLTLLLLLGVFTAPIILAFIVYKNKSLVPGESKSHGEIITPARPLNEFSLKTSEGKEFGLKDIQRKWSYVYVTESNCDEACQLTLIKMRNARLGQGAEGRRVNYYLVFTGKPVDGLLNEEFNKQHPKIQILLGEGSGVDNFLKSFHNEEDRLISRRVYMVDPIGNYMMFYENGFDSLGIMEDLKLLLKWSQIG